MINGIPIGFRQGSSLVSFLVQTISFLYLIQYISLERGLNKMQDIKDMVLVWSTEQDEENTSVTV